MNVLDLLIAGLALGAAIGGWRVGFVTRILSWIGLAMGVAVALVLVGPLLRGFDHSQPDALLLAGGMLVFAGAFIGQATTMGVAARLRPHHAGAMRTADRAAGSVVGVIGVTFLVWLFLPTVMETPGWPAESAPTSSVAQAVHDNLPEPPDALGAMRDLVGDDLPRVFDDLQPTPDLPPPPASTGIDAALAERITASVVKVEGEACDRIQDGSGVVVGRGLIVTNAHVVAGEDATSVVTVSGSRTDATVVAFDPARDLAILSAPGLDAAPLPLASASEGDIGGVFGFPGGGPLEISPFEVAREVRATGRDIYDDDRTERRVLELAADLARGDSGAALVSPSGEVVGVAFAIAPDKAGVGYALAISEVQAVLDGDVSVAVDTGPCI